MMVRYATIAGTTLLAAVLGGCNWTSFRSTTLLSETSPHLTGHGLVVETRNGRIEAMATPSVSEVVIEARLVCGGDTQEEADARAAEASLDVSRDADRRLVIKPVFPGGPRSGDAASFNVKLPDAVGVVLDTSNGPIRAQGFSGELHADTSNGSIEVTDHDGTVRVDTSNGSITLTNVSRAIEADTSNGAIRMQGVAGPVHADTSNASIKVTLAPENVGPVHLDTSNGSIALRVGPDFAGTVKLSTSNGSVSVGDESGRITSQKIDRDGGRVVIGQGGQASRLDTSNGRIELTIGG